MVERVARAIAGHFGPEFDDLPRDRTAQRDSFRRGDAYSDNQEEMLHAARAALEALRPRAFGDLPEEMALAGEGAIDRVGHGSYAAAHEVLAAMIDAALNPPPGRG